MPIREILNTVRGILSLVAEWTETDVDDKVVEVIDLILGNEKLLAWLENLLVKEDSNPDEVIFAASVIPDLGLAAGNIALLLRLLPLIIQLIRQFSK